MKPKEENEFNEDDESSQQDSLHRLTDFINVTELTRHISQVPVKEISPAALAYLGDAIYELYVRMFYLWPKQRPENYHRLVVAQVRAETQALHLRSLTPYLSNHELEIVRRGRNAAPKSPKRLNPEIYQQATSLETLVGYLYLTDYPRLIELLQKINLEKE